MTQNLVSSVPGVFSALLGLVQQAAALQTPAPAVFAFELGQYEPGSYITVHEIIGPEYEWESIGNFAQKERFEIHGIATVFSGDSPANDVTVATTVLSQTVNLFQSCVMTPVMSNRTMPLLGTTGPSPYLLLPGPQMKYSAQEGIIGGGPAGWCGVYEWSFSFESMLTPA